MSERLASLTRHSAVRFVAVGLVSFAIDLGTLVLLHGGFGVSLTVATTLAYTLGFFVNFGLNRAFTFATGGPVGVQIVKYLVLVAINLGLTILVVDGLTHVWSVYEGSKTIATALGSIVNYFAYRFWVFPVRPNPEPGVAERTGMPA